MLFTDYKKLKIVLKNLVHNAIKYTPAGTLTVGARRHNGGVEFIVADTGVGIPSDKLDNIFELFCQLHGSMAEPMGGVGLGLYMVKHLLARLGGTVSVESEVGRGSTFRVRLPVRSVEMNIPSVAEELL